MLGNTALVFVVTLVVSQLDSTKSVPQNEERNGRTLKEIYRRYNIELLPYQQGTVHETVDDMKREEPVARIKDFKVCLDEYEDEISKISLNLEKELRLCITDRTNEAAGTVSDVIADMQNTVDVADEFAQDIEDCSDKFISIICIRELVAKIPSRVAKLSKKMKMYVGDVLPFVTKLGKELTNCTTAKVGDAIKQGNKIHQSIMACVNNL